ncbi:MAG: glycosyltransferase [Elusimicrobia bacterium]|nr:glycosyltransferase [Elusimicrobiota bacterium]
MLSIVYLAYGGAEPTVFDSQVLSLLRLTKAQGVSSHLVVFHNWKEFFFKRPYLVEKTAQCLRIAGCSLDLLPRIPRNIFRINERLFKLNHAGRPAPRLIHARGFQSAALACRLKRRWPGLRVILDCRGLEAEEFLMITEREKNRSPNWLDRCWFAKIKDQEKEAVEQADHIFCVSHSLKRYLISAHGVSENRIDVIPCCADSRRFPWPPPRREFFRKKLGLENRLVLVYAGSVRAWQPADWLAKGLMAAKKAAPNAFLLILTPQRGKALKALAEHKCHSGDYCVMAADHSTMPEYLSAGDIGFLLRESHLVNEVACPTKTAEYLASGNLLITTPHPADISGIVKQEGVGEVIGHPHDWEGFAAALSRLNEELKGGGYVLRQKSRTVAEHYFFWERYLPIIIERYRTLLGA